jgi:LPXTG-motif cell wall-anchored protein
MKNRSLIASAIIASGLVVAAPTAASATEPTTQPTRTFGAVVLCTANSEGIIDGSSLVRLVVNNPSGEGFDLGVGPTAGNFGDGFTIEDGQTFFSDSLTYQPLGEPTEFGLYVDRQFFDERDVPAATFTIDCPYAGPTDEEPGDPGEEPGDPGEEPGEEEPGEENPGEETPGGEHPEDPGTEEPGTEEPVEEEPVEEEPVTEELVVEEPVAEEPVVTPPLGTPGNPAPIVPITTAKPVVATEDNLARTGSDSTALMAGGISAGALLLLGGGMLAFRRLRRS